MIFVYFSTILVGIIFLLILIKHLSIINDDPGDKKCLTIKLTAERRPSNGTPACLNSFTQERSHED